MLQPLILLVEDNDDIRYAVRRTLGKVARIVEAPTVEDAWREIRTHADVDAVVFDCQMPLKPGDETFDDTATLEIVRYAKNNLNAVLVAASANHNEELMEAGCHLALDKMYLIRDIEVLLGLAPNQVVPAAL